MLRYLKLYAYFIRFSLSKAMEFRIDFWFRIVMDCFYYFVNIAFFKILYTQTPLLAGWNEAQSMIFVVSFLAVDALHMTLFSNNFWMFPTLVNKGELDYYLIRPVSSLFFVSFRDFAANSFVNLLITFGLGVWAIARFPEPLSPLAIFGYVLLVVNGTFVFYLIHLLFILPIFWMHSSRGLQSLSYTLGKFMERPDGIFTGWVRRVLVSVLPYALIASFPARFLVEPFRGGLLLHITAVSLGFFLFILWLWSFALKNYSSASS